MVFSFGSFGNKPLTTTTPSIFGSSPTTPFTLFGNNKPATTLTPQQPSIFSQQPQQTIFGQQTQQQPQQPLNIFGQQPQQQQQSSIFGQPTQIQTPTIFGQQQQQQPTPSIFGQQQPQQGFTFTQQPQQQTLFNAPSTGFFQQPQPQVNLTQPLPTFQFPQQQLQIPQQRQPTYEEIIQYGRQLEEDIIRLRSQLSSQPLLQNQPFSPFPCNTIANNAVTIPAFLENGAPIIMQIPMGRASSLALMQGFRPVSTPQGIQFQPPDAYPKYVDNPGHWLGYEKENPHHHRLGRSPSYYSLNTSRSQYSLPPSRQQGSTCIADPYMDRPHFLRPSTAPALSSPSSTTIFFNDQHNPNLKMRTLSWRKGYGNYPYGGLSREAELINRNYEAIVNNEMFGKRTNDKIYPTLRTWRDWKWKQLDEDTVKRCQRHDIQDPRTSGHSSSFKPRYNRGVSFFDPLDSNYLSNPYRQTGPPKTSHLQDCDRHFHRALYESSNRKTPDTIGNLPGRYEEHPALRGILKKPVEVEKTSPIYHTYRYVDQSRRSNSSTQTDHSGYYPGHVWLSPVKGTVSADVIEVYRNRRPTAFPNFGGHQSGQAKFRQIVRDNCC